MACGTAITAIMSSTDHARRVDYLAIRKHSNMDDMIASVPRPDGSIPLNGAPIWPHIPLGAKLPVPERIPIGTVEFSRNKVGVDLWKNKEKLNFSIYDPNGYEFRSEYEPLHDPHLKHYFRNNICTIERLQQFGFVSPTYGATCSLKKFNEYRRFLNRIHQYYVERERKRIADETLLANQIANAEAYGREEEERSDRQAQIDIMRQHAKQRLQVEAQEKKAKQAERERRSAAATQKLEDRMIKQQMNAMEAAKLQTLKIARMQLMSSEIQRQREVDNKIRRQEKEFRYRQKKREENKEKKFWQQMRTNVHWEEMIERQQKRLEYENRLLAKQKILFDFDVEVRKRMIDEQRRRFERKFARRRRKTCCCEDKDKKKKHKKKQNKGGRKQDYLDELDFVGEESDLNYTSYGPNDDFDDGSDDDDGSESKKDDEKLGDEKDIAEREEVVQSVIGVYVKRNVKQLLNDVRFKQTQFLHDPAAMHRSNLNYYGINNNQGSTTEENSTGQKNFQVYNMTQVKSILTKSKKFDQKKSKSDENGFPRTRSVSFGNVISVGTGSMYVEPGKGLRSTKNRPPTPVTSLETLAAAVSSVPWNPLLPIADYLQKEASDHNPRVPPTSRISSAYIPRPKASKFRPSSLNLHERSKRTGIICSPDDTFGFLENEILRKEQHSDRCSFTAVKDDDNNKVISDEPNFLLANLGAIESYGARKNFAQREVLLDQESRETGLAQLNSQGSQTALTGVLSDAEGLLLDVTLDRVKRKLCSLICERLENGLDLHTKKLFRDFANQDKSFTMSSATTNLTDAIMRLDAKDILEAVELRYAADAIIYDILGSDKCAKIVQEPNDVREKDLMRILNKSEREEEKMRKALGQHNLVLPQKTMKKSQKEKSKEIQVLKEVNPKKITKTSKERSEERGIEKKTEPKINKSNGFNKFSKKSNKNETQNDKLIESLNTTISSNKINKKAVIDKKVDKSLENNELSLIKTSTLDVIYNVQSFEKDHSIETQNSELPRPDYVQDSINVKPKEIETYAKAKKRYFRQLACKSLDQSKSSELLAENENVIEENYKNI